MTSSHFEILQIIGACAIIAAIPASVWGYIFYKKQPEERSAVRLTFFLAALAVFPILLYRLSWSYFPWMNVFEWTKRYENFTLGFENFATIPISVIITFMIVGVIEEVMKLSTVHAVDDGRIRHIDDAIEFSIVAALGFSFAENIIYFFNIWITKGPENLFIPFVFRSVFSTFAHILFSGIFGYYYGVAQFANPILRQELSDKRNFIWRWFHRILKSKTDEFFHEQKMLEGLVIAVILHAIYNVFLEMNWTFLMVPYLVFGYMLLAHLFTLKKNRKQYGLLLENERNHIFSPKKIARLIRRKTFTRLEN